MKRFKNLESFEEAKKWIRLNIGFKMFDNKNNIILPDNVGFNRALGIAVQLLDSAKNSAVRAAVHQELIGGNVLLQYKTCQDGCAYYHPETDAYLGRGMIEYATLYLYDFESKEYIPEDFGYYEIATWNPLDDLELNN